MRNFSLSSTKWKKPGYELDAIASHCIQPQIRFFLLGDSHETKQFYAEFHDSIDLTFVSTKQIQKKSSNIYIICCSKRDDYEKQRDQLSKKGLIENQDFFHGEFLAPIIHLYMNNKLILDRVEIFLTSCCTLNCEKCIAYIPFFQTKYHEPLEKLKRDIDILINHKDGIAQHVDYIRKLKLLGGESLLYPYLPEYIAYIRKTYPRNIGQIRIGTNGTILPSPEIIACAREYDVIFDISDYGPAVNDKCRIHEVADILMPHDITYEIKRTGESWFDTGIPNNPLDLTSEEEISVHFHKCAMFCRNFHDGKLFFCCNNFAAVKSGLHPENSNDYLDFHDPINKQKILEYEIGFSTLGYTTLCSKCRGCSVEANQTFVSVAKQIL